MTSKTSPPTGLIFIVALTSMIGPFTIDTYLPSFPAIEAEFDISRALLSQSLAFYLAAFAISTLFWGPLSDKLGRRPVLLGTLSLYVFASLGCALADDYSSFLFFRLLQGVAAGGGLAAGRTMIRDAHNPEDAHRAMSQVMMMFAVAPAVAPLVGGWLHEAFGWHSVFYFLAIYSALVLLLIFIKIPETHALELRQPFHPRYIVNIYGQTLKHHRFRSLALTVACGFGGMFLYIAGAPTVIFDFLGLDSHDFGVIFIPMVIGMMTGAWITGRLAHRWPRERTVQLALGLMAVASLSNAAQALWLSPNAITVVLPLALYACAIGVAMPAFTVLSMDCFPKNRGSASAMQGFSQMAGNALVSSLAVPFLTDHPSHLALGQLALVTIALLIWWRIPPQPAQ